MSERQGPLNHEKQRQISEWLTTALRHRPFHKGRLSDRFLRGHHSALSATDGQSYHSCPTTGQLKDRRITIASAWRL
eukprot:5074291-Pyramimonas_sp.AAC.2